MNGGAAPQRILLVRTSALGDVVHGLAVLAALRRRFPAAEIGWIVDEAFAPLLAGHAQLDRLFAVPLRRWRRSARGRAGELARFLRRLRAFRADAALDLMGNHKGALLALVSGARRRIGHRAADRREPASALWLGERVAAGAVHAVDRQGALCAALGAPLAPVDFAPEAIACGRDRVPAAGYVYLHPGAAWENKRYPAERWGAVAAELAGATGLRVLVGAAPGEEALAHRVVEASGGRALLFAAPSIDDLAGVVRGARLVLGGDTGAIHLARAFARPVVAVHGPTDPARHGPWNEPEAIVVRRLPCSYCHRRMPGTKSCLDLVAPQEIAARALARLAANAASGVV